MQVKNLFLLLSKSGEYFENFIFPTMDASDFCPSNIEYTRRLFSQLGMHQIFVQVILNIQDVYFHNYDASVFCPSNIEYTKRSISEVQILNS